MSQIDIHEQDCLAGMREHLAGGSVDLVVTSPPYNLGIGYSTYKDTADRGEYLSWCHGWVTEVKRVLADGGSFFLNVGAAPKDPYFPHEILLAVRDLFVLQNTFHWIKSISLETRAGETVSAGHFKPINSRRFVNDTHEYIFHLTKTGDVPLDRRAEGVGVPYQDKSNIARWGHTGGADLRCRGNAWFIPYQTIKSRDQQRPHPASYPPELVRRCVAIHGRDRVKHLLDPFLGIGSSALAAQALGVPRFTGFDIDPSYLQVARERLAAREEELFPD